MAPLTSARVSVNGPLSDGRKVGLFRRVELSFRIVFQVLLTVTIWLAHKPWIFAAVLTVASIGLALAANRSQPDIRWTTILGLCVVDLVVVVSLCLALHPLFGLLALVGAFPCSTFLTSWVCAAVESPRGQDTGRRSS